MEIIRRINYIYNDLLPFHYHFLLYSHVFQDTFKIDFSLYRILMQFPCFNIKYLYNEALN